MKKTVIEIIIIVVVSTVIALLYNFIRPDGIPFFPPPKIIVSDSLLFGNISDEVATVQDFEQDTVLTLQTVEDTVKKKKNTVDNKTNETATVATNFTAENLKNVKRNSDGYAGISLDQMKRIVSSGGNNFIIIDTRREGDFLQGHIPGAINIFSYDAENVVIERILYLPKNKTLILYCDGGSCDLSHRLATLLENFGYEKFYLYEGGWEEWSKNQ